MDVIRYSICINLKFQYFIFFCVLQVQFYVDGNMVISDDDNLEVVDDWFFYKINKVQDIKFIVGVCWEGVYLILYRLLLNQYIYFFDWIWIINFIQD